MRHESTLWVPDLEENLSTLRLNADASHHITKVMRLREESSLTLCNGKGLVAQATLLESGRHSMLRIDSCHMIPRPPLAIEAWLPIMKPSRLEIAVEKLCELGIERIRLMTSENTGNARKKTDLPRLERLLVTALQQSRNPWLPILDPPKPLHELLKNAVSPLVVAAPEGGSKNLDPHLHCPVPTDGNPVLILLCGPEGGFTQEELENLAKRNCIHVGLGPWVLRAETAIIGLATAIHARFASLADLEIHKQSIE